MFCGDIPDMVAIADMSIPAIHGKLRDKAAHSAAPESKSYEIHYPQGGA